MKKVILLIGLILGGFVFGTAHAQIRVNLRINIGSQPTWGPVGYDHVEYYYMPDIDIFYYVPGRQYIYQQQGRWIFSASLPYRYRTYDMYTGYKVVINDARPYNRADTYRRQYAIYKGRHDQEVIRNSRDKKYYQVKGHPEYNNWKKNNRRNH